MYIFNNVNIQQPKTIENCNFYKQSPNEGDNTTLNILGRSGAPKCEKCSIVHSGANLLHTWTYYGLVGMWEHWSRNTWMLVAHMGTSTYQHGNDYMGTQERLYESVGTTCGNVGTTYGNDNVEWQANMIVENRGNYTVFHVGMLNMHRVHLFLVLYIELAILTWSIIYNTSHWIGQQTLKKI